MNTKARIFILLAFSILINIGNAQVQQFKVTYYPPAKILNEEYNIDTSNVSSVRLILDTSSVDSFVSGEAALFLAERGYTDIIPKVRILYDSSLNRQTEKGWKFIKFNYLLSLYLLNEPNVPILVNTYIDTMILIFNDEKIGKRGVYSSTNICNAFTIMASLGDYSRFNLFNSLFDQDRDGMTLSGINLLNAYGEKSEFRTEVYQRLKSLVSSPDIEIPNSVVYALGRYTYFPETQTILRQIALENNSYSARSFARDALAIYYKDNFVITAAIQTAKSTTDTLAFGLAIMDIENFPSPIALVNLIELNNSLQPGYFKDKVARTIEYYEVPQPPQSMSIITMVDTLANFNQQCASFDWLGSQLFITQLGQYITDSKVSIILKDSINCARKIKQFQQSIDNEYKDTLNITNNFITTEG